jgi:SAM-dependent methyltransferase
MRRKRPAASLEAYDAFAYAYDQALGSRFFEAILPRLDAILDRYPTNERTHLDVACGTGKIVQHFRATGWKSWGIDASLAMLEIAKSRTPALICGDFRELPLQATFSRITCMYDSLNHLRMRNELVATFRSIAKRMDKDSIFIFDMNHPAAYETVWATTEPYLAVGADYRLEMATTFRTRDARAKALITGWAEVAGKRVEIREVREQRAWNEREISESLSDAGLVPLEVTAFDPYAEEGDELDPVKLLFVCQTASED